MKFYYARDRKSIDRFELEYSSGKFLMGSSPKDSDDYKILSHDSFNELPLVIKVADDEYDITNDPDYKWEISPHTLAFFLTELSGCKYAVVFDRNQYYGNFISAQYYDFEQINNIFNLTPENTIHWNEYITHKGFRDNKDIPVLLGKDSIYETFENQHMKLLENALYKNSVTEVFWILQNNSGEYFYGELKGKEVWGYSFEKAMTFVDKPKRSIIASDFVPKKIKITAQIDD